MMRLDLAGLADASRDALMAEWREVVGRLFNVSAFGTDLTI